MRNVILLALLLGACGLFAGEKKHEPRDPGAVAGPDKLPLHEGLIAHYFTDPVEWNGVWRPGDKPDVDVTKYTFDHYAYTKIEPLINHITSHRGWFSVCWVGWLKVPPGRSEGKDSENAEEFSFDLWMDDGARMFLDGKKVVDDWRPCAETDPTSHREFTATLQPGPHRIVIEYFQGESLAQKDPDPARFYWSCQALKIPRQIVPAAHFFHTAADLQDYVPSEGLSPDDERRMSGGKKPVEPQARGEKGLTKVDSKVDRK